jgi:ABC-type lipoprotein release transport system permease subunit
LSFTACIAGGITASILAAIYPASFASRMVPATALRTNI